jgi:hypothetical protein
MKILKKKMSRRDFLKFVFAGAAVVSLAGIFPKVSKLKANLNEKSEAYGNSSYGGK